MRAVPESDIGAKAPVSDREDDRQPLYAGVQHELDGILRQCQVAIENARDSDAIGIAPDREAGPASHPRIPLIGPDH